MPTVAKPPRIGAQVSPSLFDYIASHDTASIPAEAGTIPAQVTDSWDALRTALGHSAPQNLASAKAKARALRNIVR